ncbi:MAG: hypothetical protein IKP31_01355 [Lachnospiraceae bacterium]|nr:hypothetical protein [Lachnospiraceae bacterium]
MEGSELYREKSIEKVSTPEQLNDYIRVTSPSVWAVLIALVVLMLGVLVWCVFGSITIHNENGELKTVAPITFVTN